MVAIVLNNDLRPDRFILFDSVFFLYHTAATLFCDDWSIVCIAYWVL